MPMRAASCMRRTAVTALGMNSRAKFCAKQDRMPSCVRPRATSLFAPRPGRNTRSWHLGASPHMASRCDPGTRPWLNILLGEPLPASGATAAVTSPDCGCECHPSRYGADDHDNHEIKVLAPARVSCWPRFILDASGCCLGRKPRRLRKMTSKEAQRFRFGAELAVQLGVLDRSQHLFEPRTGLVAFGDQIISAHERLGADGLRRKFRHLLAREIVQLQTAMARFAI